jgi:putative oxidoreductase
MSDASGAVLLAGRILFAVFFARAGYRHLRDGDQMTGFAQGVGFPMPTLASWPAGSWLIAGSVSIAVGIWPDIGALMLIAFLVPAAVWFHDFWKAPTEQRMMQEQFFWRNVTLIAACVALFGIFTGLGQGLRYSLTRSLIDLT